VTETFVAMIALLVAILASVGVVAAHAALRVCRRDWAAQAIDNTRNRT